MSCEPFPEPKRNRRKKNFAATINRLLVWDGMGWDGMGWDGMVEVVGEREREGLMGLF